MDLNIFVREQPDNDISWKDKFSKSDITFLDDADYERFKKDLANYLFELRYGRQNLLDDIEAGCKEEFSANYEIVFETLIDFINTENRPVFDPYDPDIFIIAFENHFLLKNIAIIDLKTIGQVTKKILVTMNERLRTCFVK